ncbi:MAG: hypothetical protein IJH12_02510 [Clostridia bacterium]|nr:hypothetical protein [Clostridia bacterium]
MGREVEELIKALEKVNALMTKENLKKATTEELLKYNEQINRIKAMIIEVGY